MDLYNMVTHTACEYHSYISHKQLTYHYILSESRYLRLNFYHNIMVSPDLTISDSKRSKSETLAVQLNKALHVAL